MTEKQEDETQEPIDADDLYMRPKPKSKLIRVMTVIAYILSVSMAAILLSVYYIFVWKDQSHLKERGGPISQQMIGHSPYYYNYSKYLRSAGSVDVSSVLESDESVKGMKRIPRERSVKGTFDQKLFKEQLVSEHEPVGTLPSFDEVDKSEGFVEKSLNLLTRNVSDSEERNFHIELEDGENVTSSVIQEREQVLNDTQVTNDLNTTGIWKGNVVK